MNLTIYFNTYRKVVNTIHKRKEAKIHEYMINHKNKFAAETQYLSILSSNHSLSSNIETNNI